MRAAQPEHGPRPGKDSEASAVRTRRHALAAGLALLCALLFVFLPGPASASHPPEYELLESFGPDGTGSSNFSGATAVAYDQQSEMVYIGDALADKLYKFDRDGTPVDWGGSAPYIADNEISGLSLPFEGIGQVAVDSVSHVVYVTSNNTVTAFQANGEPAVFSAGPWVGTNAISGFTQLSGIAVDADGAIYASDQQAGTVRIFAPSGAEVTSFAAEAPRNLAVDTAGAVYVNRGVPNCCGYSLGTVLKFTPSAPLPVTGSTTFAPAPTPVDSSPAYSVAVDPATNNVYIIVSTNPGIEVKVHSEAGGLITEFAQAGVEHTYYGLAVDGDSTRVFLTDLAGSFSQVKIFQPKPPPLPAAPTIEFLGSRDVGNTSATLRARINPNSVATGYRFEYGPEDCAISTCASLPAIAVGIGAGHDSIAVSQRIEGLQAGTTYHYRVIAENSMGVVAAASTLRTQGSGLGFELIDHRAWEMVTPSVKYGAIILSGLDGGQEAGGQLQAAADGSGLAYMTRGSIEENPPASRSLELASALARRGAGGSWSSTDISPPNSRVVPLALGQQSEYKIFNADLSEALLEPRDGLALSPETSEPAPYWRQNSQPPLYRPLVTGKEGFANVPADIEFGSVGIRAATPDLDHVVLWSGVGLAHGDPPRTSYKWFDGQLEPISVLPIGEGGETVQGIAGSADRSMRHAISDNGERVFWTSGYPGGWGTSGSTRHLYARDTAADATARLDIAPAGGGVDASEPVFQGASADGTVAFFTGSAPLTADASPSGADLYRCEMSLSSPLTGCDSLIDISAPLPGSGESSEVLGVVSGLSEDGTRAYFAARGKLDTKANQAGDFVVPGEPNLYVWQEGKGVRFIARLSEEDEPDWGIAREQSSDPREAYLSAASSPNGRYFAFMSERSLSGEDNLNAAWEPVERVFRYDALADRLDCVTCDPTGVGPEGAVVSASERPLIDPRRQWPGRLVAAILPQPPVIGTGDATIPLHRTRVVHDNGRIYFNAIDPLVPADSNGEWDVYQYEPNGAGSCDASSGGASVPAAGGCVSLISSGTADGPAGFLDAGARGDDIFFFTPARLSVLDQDAEADIYDARVDGIVASLRPRVECLGESCQAPPAVPSDPTPGTATFQGAADPQPQGKRRCPKGKRKVHRKGRVHCLPRKNRKSHSRNRRTGQDREAAR